MRDSSGFSLVEVMIAALILVVGAGAAFSLIDSANRSVSFNSARVGATNLGRELAEYARTTDYDLLQPAQIVTALRKHTSIAGTISGGVWTIQRRGVTYTVTTKSAPTTSPRTVSGPFHPRTPARRPPPSPARRPSSTRTITGASRTRSAGTPAAVPAARRKPRSS